MTKHMEQEFPNRGRKATYCIISPLQQDKGEREYFFITKKSREDGGEVCKVWPSTREQIMPKNPVYENPVTKERVLSCLIMNIM
jgi:hypothetical protein